MEATMVGRSARRPARKTAQKPGTGTPPPRSDSIRDKAVAAFMALLAERSFEEIGLAGSLAAPACRCRTCAANSAARSAFSLPI
jgi:hypothetical protein